MNQLPLKIVLVDDDPSSIFIAKEYISMVIPDAKIRTFLEGREALTYLKQRPADLLFVDLRMPGMDGYEFLSVYSGFHQKERTRVFVLSSSIDPRDIQTMSKIDLVEAFLSKPLDAKRLKELLALGKKKAPTP